MACRRGGLLISVEKSPGGGVSPSRIEAPLWPREGTASSVRQAVIAAGTTGRGLAVVEPGLHSSGGGGTEAYLAVTLLCQSSEKTVCITSDFPKVVEAGGGLAPGLAPGLAH